jgi:hypothetical protein
MSWAVVGVFQDNVGMDNFANERLIALDTGVSIWERFYMVSPLTVIGAKEGQSFDRKTMRRAGAQPHRPQ